jgi:hypothetical protein
MTQAVNEFFRSEDMENFAVKNDDSAMAAKPLWVSVKRHGNLHLALALGLGQTVTGHLMRFYRDMSMSCLHQLCEHQAPWRKIALHRPRQAAVAQVGTDVCSKRINYHRGSC